MTRLEGALHDTRRRTMGIGHRRALAAVGATALALGVLAAAGAPAVADTDPATVDEGLWYYTRTGVAEAHQQTTGQGVTIAVLDGPLNPGVPDLVGANVQVSGTCRDDAGAVAAPTSTGEDALHGTQVTSVLAGTGAGTGGQAGVRGVAPGATVLHVSVFPPGWDPDGFGEAECALPDGAARGYQYADAIDAAVAAGADIITMSFAGDIWGDAEVAALLRAYAAGVIVLAGPDNEMGSGDTMLDPAGLNGVVSVARHDIDGALPASMAPNGPYLGVVAPGVDLRAPTVVDGSWERYSLVDGNSFATPWTAGVLALAWSLHPDATANQMIQALIHTTATTPEGGEPTHDDVFGYGPVSVPRLLAADPATFPDDNPLLRPLDDADAWPSTAAILEATGKAVPQETTEPTAEPSPTVEPAEGDEADDDTDASATLPLPAILGGAGLLLAVAITTAVLLRRRSATPAATSTSPTREEA